jgi:hypothetical protein
MWSRACRRANGDGESKGTGQPTSLRFRRLDLLPSDAHQTDQTDGRPSAVLRTMSEDLVPTSDAVPALLYSICIL